MMDTSGPGLQPQRTVLAWNRTSLALLANALLILRSGTLHNSNFIVWLGILVLVMAGLTMLFAQHRHHLLLRGGLDQTEDSSLASRAIPWLAAAVGLTAFGGLLAILLDMGLL